MTIGSLRCGWHATHVSMGDMPPSANLTQLLRVRWAVRGVLTLGVAASVTANVLHAQPNAIAMTIAAWPPLALLLTIELVSRVPVHQRWRAIVRRAGTTAIAGIAAWVSYWHMVGVAFRYGESGAGPYLLPFSVDGLIAVMSISLVELAGRIRTAAELAPEEPAAEPVPGQPEEPAEEPVDDSTSDSTPAVNPDHPTAVKIRRLRARQPAATQEEIASKARVSVRTVTRYWPVTAPDIAPDAPASAAERTPELITT